MKIPNRYLFGAGLVSMGGPVGQNHSGTITINKLVRVSVAEKQPNVKHGGGNMTDEIKFLLAKFENKLASFWQLDGEMQWCEDDRIYKMERRQRILQAEVDQARADLVEAVEKLEAANA